MKRSSSSIYAFFDFYIISPSSKDFLLNRVYIKRPRSPYKTLFLKNIFVPASKISKLLFFQLKENEFSTLQMLGAIIDF